MGSIRSSWTNTTLVRWVVAISFRWSYVVVFSLLPLKLHALAKQLSGRLVMSSVSIYGDDSALDPELRGYSRGLTDASWEGVISIHPISSMAWFWRRKVGMHPSPSRLASTASSSGV